MTQIRRKFIEDNAIDGTKARLENNQALRARNAAGNADVDLLKLTAADILELQKLPRAADGLPVPSNDKEFATLEYIKNYLEGKTDAKDAVDFLFDSDVSGTFTAGSGSTSATLVGTGGLTADGTALGATHVGLRFGLVGQTAGEQNGIYVLTACDGNDYTLERAEDFNQVDDAAGSEVTSGAHFKVIQGTDYAGYECLLTTDDPIDLDVTPLTFVKYPTTLHLIAGDMLNKTGNTFSVDLASLSGLESNNPGAPTGKLRIRVDTAAAEPDKSTKVNGSGALVARVSQRSEFTLSATDITNQYVDLPHVAERHSVEFMVVGGGPQHAGTDYSVNYTGGAGSNPRVTFLGGLANGGVSELVEGDVVVATYRAFA